MEGKHNIRRFIAAICIVIFIASTSGVGAYFIKESMDKGSTIKAEGSKEIITSVKIDRVNIERDIKLPVGPYEGD